ncbi:MAG: AI-2E family transporter [Actinobacteria bacterium]|nr:AI-2E family transporter [Actinomycetota bacterium]
MLIKIPRWLQVAALPVAALVVFYVASSMSHAVFAFIMATLIALLLNPLVTALKRLKIPRGIGATLVYVSFFALLILLLILAVPPLAGQLTNLLDRLPQFEADFRMWLVGVEEYLAGRNITLNLVGEMDRIGEWIAGESAGIMGALFNVGVGVVGGLANFIIIVITSLYMLVDGRRIFHFLLRLVPGDEATGRTYLLGMQTAFTRYIKSQLLLGAAVGLASGLGVWMLGWRVINIWPEGARYALLFGVWAGVTELIPYVGPWLGAIPPVMLALFHSPGAAIWVAVIYFTIQQLEGHILVPNVMGASLGVHPLVVIFAVLAGAQIAGILGMLAVLPILAMLKHTMGFYRFKLSSAPWIGDDGVTVISCEVESPSPGASRAAGPQHDDSGSVA